MQKKQHRKLTVYLSYSYLLPSDLVRSLKKRLEASGFNVLNSKKGDEYDNSLLNSSDFVLFFNNADPREIDRGTWSTTVGRGQYTDAIRATYGGIPAFVLHHYSDRHNLGKQFLVSKLNEDVDNFILNDKDDWVNGHGEIESYVLWRKPIDLECFVKGFFSMNYNVVPIMAKNSFRKELLLLLR